MAFTLITITGGPFTRPDGQPASGRVTALLSARMVNGATPVEPTPIYGILNGAGMLKDSSGLSPWTVEANDDPGTSPSSPTAHYEFTIELDGAPLDTFTAIVPHTAVGGTVDLSALI